MEILKKINIPTFIDITVHKPEYLYFFGKSSKPPQSSLTGTVTREGLQATTQPQDTTPLQDEILKGFVGFSK